MSKKILKIELTPITEDKLVSVGFEKVEENDRDADEYKFVLRLPKDSTDPHCMCLVSSYTTEAHELRIPPGEFIVELFDSGGLGICFSMEEVELLYFVLTKKNLYEK